MRLLINMTMGAASCSGAAYFLGNYGGIAMAMGIIVGFVMCFVSLWETL